MVCLGPARVLFKAYEVPETCRQVYCKAEEYLVVDEDTLVLTLSYVKRGDVAVNYSHSAFLGCREEVIVDLVQSSVPL